jgi:hypothetical protein
MGSTFSEQNAEKLKQAQDRAKNDLDEKKAALAEAEAAKAACLKEAADLTAALNEKVEKATELIDNMQDLDEDEAIGGIDENLAKQNIVNEYLEARRESQRAAETAKKAKQEAFETNLKGNALAMNVAAGKAPSIELKDSIEATRAANERANAAQKAADEWSKKVESLKDLAEEAMKSIEKGGSGGRDSYAENEELSDVQRALEEKDAAEKQLNEKKQECDKLQGPIDDAKAAITYTDEDIEKMKDLPMRKKPQYYSMAHIQFGNSDELKDLRNLPNSVNFRKYKMEPGVKNALTMADSLAANNEEKLNPSLMTSPSKTFYMNQDYLFSDTLAKVNLNKESLKSAPEIQPLLLNEFQPYYKLELNDLYGGMLNGIGTVLGMADGLFKFGGWGAKFRMGAQNAFIDLISKDPSVLYDMSGTDVYNGTDASQAKRNRKFLSPDPVQTVQNMFQRRHMAKYI